MNVVWMELVKVVCARGHMLANFLRHFSTIILQTLPHVFSLIRNKSNGAEFLNVPLKEIGTKTLIFVAFFVVSFHSVKEFDRYKN